MIQLFSLCSEWKLMKTISFLEVLDCFPFSLWLKVLWTWEGCIANERIYEPLDIVPSWETGWTWPWGGSDADLFPRGTFWLIRASHGQVYPAEWRTTDSKATNTLSLREIWRKLKLLAIVKTSKYAVALGKVQKVPRVVPHLFHISLWGEKSGNFH